MEQLVVRKDMDVNEHKRLSHILHLVRKDMDVNEHKRLSHILHLDTY
jgi:hypothetical protein